MKLKKFLLVNSAFLLLSSCTNDDDVSCSLFDSFKYSSIGYKYSTLFSTGEIDSLNYNMEVSKNVFLSQLLKRDSRKYTFFINKKKFIIDISNEKSSINISLCINNVKSVICFKHVGMCSLIGRNQEKLFFKIIFQNCIIFFSINLEQNQWQIIEYTTTQ